MAEIREHCKNKIKEVFENKPLKSFSCDLITTIIEKSIYNASIKEAKAKLIERSWESKNFKWIYKNKYNSLMGNIKNNKNADFVINKINTGEFLPEKIVYMKPQELYPELWESILLKMRLKDERIEKLTKEENQSGTDLFRCGKCKKSNCTYYQMQTRSADEPMTSFVTCLNCHNRWKC
jgi:transcription elongation factor S-II